MAFTIAVAKDKFDASLRLIIDFLDGKGSYVKKYAKKLRESNPTYEKLSREAFPALSDEEYENCQREIAKAHSELEDILVSYGCADMDAKDPKANARKVINTYVKTGFIMPLLEGYVPESIMYLEAKDLKAKKYIKGQVFYQYGSSNASYSENYYFLKNGMPFSDISLIFKTIYNLESHTLTKEDIAALMVTVPYTKSPKMTQRNHELIDKGYLTKKELQEQYNLSKYIFLLYDKDRNDSRNLGVKYFENHFEEIIEKGFVEKCKFRVLPFEKRKYNQIGFMMRAICDYPGFIKRNNVIHIKNLSDEWEEEDSKKSTSKRDPVQHQIYRNYLIEESEKLYKKPACFVDKIGWKGLVASHIVPFNECEPLGHKEWEYDGDNGLLLSPNIDAYFDKHDISFDDDGSIMVPRNDFVVRKEVKELLEQYHLDEEVLNERRLCFIRMHREQFKNKHC